MGSDPTRRSTWSCASVRRSRARAPTTRRSPSIAARSSWSRRHYLESRADRADRRHLPRKPTCPPCSPTTRRIGRRASAATSSGDTLARCTRRPAARTRRSTPTRRPRQGALRARDAAPADRAARDVGREDEPIKQYEAVVKVAPGEPASSSSWPSATSGAAISRRRWRCSSARGLVHRRSRRAVGAGRPLPPLGQGRFALAAYERLANSSPTTRPTWSSSASSMAEGDKQPRPRAGDLEAHRQRRPRPPTPARRRPRRAPDEIDGLAHYAKAIKLEAQERRALQGPASIYEGQKQFAEAMADWEMAMSLLGDKAVDRTARREARRHVGLAADPVRRQGGRLPQQVAGRVPQEDSGRRRRWHFLVEYFDRRAQAG